MTQAPDAPEGAWEVSDAGEPDYLDGIQSQYCVQAASGRPIAYVFRSDEARLIAAAPDLLEAAKLALSIAESWIHDQLDGTSMVDDELARLQPVRAAIAKATTKNGGEA